MPLFSQVYAGQFVNAVELPVGRRITAVISAASAETVGQGEQANLRIVLDLRALDGRPWPKQVVLNKTNGTMLAAVYGDNTDNWINRHVEIWREKVMFSGRLVDAIRMSAAAAAPSASNGPAPVIAMPGPVQAPAAAQPTPPAQPTQSAPPPMATPRRTVIFPDGVRPTYADDIPGAASGPVGDDLDDAIPF